MPDTDRPQPTRSQRRRAIKVLANVMIDESAPIHARVSASRALINAEPKAADESADPKGIRDHTPAHVLVLPSNGREGQPFKYGFNEGASVMIYRTPAERDEIE